MPLAKHLNENTDFIEEYGIEASLDVIDDLYTFNPRFRDQVHSKYAKGICQTALACKSHDFIGDEEARLDRGEVIVHFNKNTNKYYNLIKNSKGKVRQLYLLSSIVGDTSNGVYGQRKIRGDWWWYADPDPSHIINDLTKITNPSKILLMLVDSSTPYKDTSFTVTVSSE